MWFGWCLHRLPQHYASPASCSKISYCALTLLCVYLVPVAVKKALHKRAIELIRADLLRRLYNLSRTPSSKISNAYIRRKDPDRSATRCSINMPVPGDGEPSDLLEGVQFITPPPCREGIQDKASFLELPSLEASGNKKADSRVLQKKDDEWWLAGRGIRAQCSGWQPCSSCTILPLTLKSWATRGWFLQQGGVNLHVKADEIQWHKCRLSASIPFRPARAFLPQGKTTFPDFSTWFAILPPTYCFYKMVFSYFQSLISCIQGHGSVITGGRWGMPSSKPGWFTILMAAVWGGWQKSHVHLLE